MKKQLLPLSFLGLATTLAAQPSIEPSIQTDTVYIASSTYYSAEKTPISFLNIDRVTFQQRSTGQEPSFILSQLSPSITVHSDAGSYQGYSYMRMRGIDQTRINFTLGGMPLNEPEDQGAYFSNYPDLLNSVGTIQVQRGVGTTKNGSASYAGSIQLGLPNIAEKMQTQIGIGYGSYNSYRAFANFNSGLIAGNKLSISARLSYLHSDGYRDHSQNTSQSAFFHALYIPNSRHSFHFTSLTGRQLNQMAWLGSSDSMLQANPRHNANSAQEDDNFLQTLAGIGHNYYIIPYKLNLRSQVYYTHLRGNYDFDLNNFLELPSTSELYNYNFLSHWIGAYSNLEYASKNTQISGGLNAYFYQRRHLGSEKTLGELYTNTGYKREISSFARIEHTKGKFNLFADLQIRYTNFSYSGAVVIAPIDWTFFNPKLGLSYDISPKLQAYLSAGKTGREPTRNDMFMGSDDLAGDSLGLPFLGNTKAEQVIDIELGTRWRSEKIQAELNGFFMTFNNEIVLNGALGPNSLVLTDNVESSIRTGAELSVQYRINDFISLQNATAYTYSRIRDQNINFSPILTPKIIVNQSVTLRRWGAYLLLNARYQSGSYIDLGNSASIDGYFLLNAQIGYEYRGWAINVFGNNLLNTKYYNNAYIGYDGNNRYFAQAPINFYVALSKTF
jgi:iron complex outermembrane recepter protein